MGEGDSLIGEKERGRDSKLPEVGVGGEGLPLEVPNIGYI